MAPASPNPAHVCFKHPSFPEEGFFTGVNKVTILPLPEKTCGYLRA
jgi:hypothetical protein